MNPLIPERPVGPVNPGNPENTQALGQNEAGPSQPELERVVTDPAFTPQSVTQAVAPDPTLVADPNNIPVINQATENQTAVNVDSPAQALDGDLIEEAWVEKVDNIVAANRDDPHKEEEAAENLSQDYLKKRFGIDVKKS